MELNVLDTEALHPEKASINAHTHINQLGLRYYNQQNGNSLLHEAANAEATAIFVYIKASIPVNTQNFEGDTALHLAVRCYNRGTSRALLMSGADLCLRNKLGQTAGDEAIGDMKELLHQFRPGLVAAVTKAEPVAIHRLARLWCNPHAVIKDGRSALELLSMQSNSDENACSCYIYLKEHQDTLELAHAVLADDLEALLGIINTSKGWTANYRYKDKRGMTPLSCAIELNNLHMARLLVERADSSVNIRVRETENELETIPLYFKTLSACCSQELWAFSAQHINSRQDYERDPAGNTAILRALCNGKSSSFVAAMLEHQQGLTVTDRNVCGETLREVAERLQRDDVVSVIDEYLMKNCDRGLLMNLPLRFYGIYQMNITNAEGKSLKECAVEGKNTMDIQATSHYTAIEEKGIELFDSITMGDVKLVAQLNTANYKDKNGYTALIKAIGFSKAEVVDLLVTEKPELKLQPDNNNRYPLHYAYALPPQQGKHLCRMLLAQKPELLEHCRDLQGRSPADYAFLRDTQELIQMLDDVCTLDPFGKRDLPLSPSPMSPLEMDTLADLKEETQMIADETIAMPEDAEER